MYWILDFDDTLLLGPDTWALQTVMPRLAQEHQLPFDTQLFNDVTVKAQELSNSSDDDEAVQTEMEPAQIAFRAEMILKTGQLECDEKLGQYLLTME